MKYDRDDKYEKSNLLVDFLLTNKELPQLMRNMSEDDILELLLYNIIKKEECIKSQSENINVNLNMATQTAIEWLEMEIVKLETKYAIPGKIYELCEQAKRMSEVETQPGDYCAVCGSQEFWNNNDEEE